MEGKNIQINTPSYDKLRYIKIDHKNQLNYFDEDSTIKLKLSLYTTLASIEEEMIGREINKLFEKLIPNPNDDLFKININISKLYMQEYILAGNYNPYSVNNKIM